MILHVGESQICPKSLLPFRWRCFPAIGARTIGGGTKSSLRASRETELQETFPAHVVCYWIGNSEIVARKHYLMTTDEHFRRAVEKVPVQAAQKAAQLATPILPNATNAAYDNGRVVENRAISQSSTRWGRNRT